MTKGSEVSKKARAARRQGLQLAYRLAHLDIQKAADPIVSTSLQGIYISTKLVIFRQQGTGDPMIDWSNDTNLLLRATECTSLESFLKNTLEWYDHRHNGFKSTDFELKRSMLLKIGNVWIPATEESYQRWFEDVVKLAKRGDEVFMIIGIDIATPQQVPGRVRE